MTCRSSRECLSRRPNLPADRRQASATPCRTGSARHHCREPCRSSAAASNAFVLGSVRRSSSAAVTRPVACRRQPMTQVRRRASQRRVCAVHKLMVYGRASRCGWSAETWTLECITHHRDDRLLRETLAVDGQRGLLRLRHLEGGQVVGHHGIHDVGPLKVATVAQQAITDRIKRDVEEDQDECCAALPGDGPPFIPQEAQ